MIPKNCYFANDVHSKDKLGNSGNRFNDGGHDSDDKMMSMSMKTVRIMTNLRTFRMINMKPSFAAEQKLRP